MRRHLPIRAMVASGLASAPVIDVLTCRVRANYGHNGPTIRLRCDLVGCARKPAPPGEWRREDEFAHGAVAPQVMSSPPNSMPRAASPTTPRRSGAAAHQSRPCIAERDAGPRSVPAPLRPPHGGTPRFRFSGTLLNARRPRCRYRAGAEHFIQRRRFDLVAARLGGPPNQCAAIFIYELPKRRTDPLPTPVDAEQSGSRHVLTRVAELARWMPAARPNGRDGSLLHPPQPRRPCRRAARWMSMLKCASARSGASPMPVDLIRWRAQQIEGAS